MEQRLRPLDAVLCVRQGKAPGRKDSNRGADVIHLSNGEGLPLALTPCHTPPASTRDAPLRSQTRRRYLYSWRQVCVFRHPKPLLRPHQFSESAPNPELLSGAYKDPESRYDGFPHSFHLPFHLSFILAWCLFGEYSHLRT